MVFHGAPCGSTGCCSRRRCWFGCLISTKRLLAGAVLLAAVIGAATLVRVQGLLLDGMTPYNLDLLRPEMAMLTLSAIGISLERRRRARG